MFDGPKRLPLKEIFGIFDDSDYYKIILIIVFRILASFEVREDIEIPQKEDDDGTVISFEDGRIGYFKIQRNELTDEEYESIFNVSYFLQDKYGDPIVSYILCEPEIEIREYDGLNREGIIIAIASLKNNDGDYFLEKLENKRKNRENFSFQDYIHHLLLPYMGYKNKDEFLPKYQRYIMETMFDNAEIRGMEVYRF